VAHSLSAKKRVRQNAKSRMVNRARKSAVRTQLKKFELSLAAGNAEAAKQEYHVLARKLDKVASTSTMHKNTAARMKSRLSKKLKNMKG
jgi:small subunit ribosomal protein S20